MEAVKHMYHNQSRLLYASKVSREIDVTYAHLVTILNQLEEKGIIKYYTKDKRRKLIELTNKGKQLYELILKFESLGITL